MRQFVGYLKRVSHVAVYAALSTHAFAQAPQKVQSAPPAAAAALSQSAQQRPPTPAPAQAPVASAASTAPGKATTSDEVSTYCAAIAPTEAEVRIAWEMKKLKELDEQVKKAVEDLQTKANDARTWVEKREAMEKQANDAMIAIFAKMPGEAASSELTAMEETKAAAILSKLNPRVASTILSNMDSGKAARLNAILMSGPDGSKS